MDFDLNFKFMGVPEHQVTKESLVKFIEDTDTKRLCFAMPKQDKPLREGLGDVKMWFNLPFRNTIGPILQQKIGISVRDRKDSIGCFYPCKTDEEVSKIQNFVVTHKNLVFLRDTLDLSLALSMRELDVESGARTEMGQLEYLVKYEDDVDRTLEKQKIIEILKDVLQNLPYFKDADYVCAIPSSKPFMREIVAQLEDFVDISDSLCWHHKDKSAKDEEDGHAKLEALESSEFEISEGLSLKDKVILLVDDLYRSGITMQYVALKLKEAGAKRVFGIALVKGLRNK